MKTLATIALMLACFASVTAQAQWVNEQSVGIPRLSNGQPNLAAPAPRTADNKPDFSGVWLAAFHPGYIINLAADLKATDVEPWATKVYDQHLNDVGKDDPGTIGCQPLGPRYITGGGGIAIRSKLIQTPSMIVVLQEDLTYRQLFMDGRKLPNKPIPSFMGSSVAHWDDDTLVVNSDGFKEGTWLDYGGHPHTESLHMTERLRRVDFGHIERQITITDPGTFKQPITVVSNLVLAPDTDLLEYVCTETPADRFHLVGRTAKEQQVRVAPAILAKYAGAYDMMETNVFGIRTVSVYVSGDQLYADFNGKGRVLLVPLSERMFSPRVLGTYEFVLDQQGNVTHILAHSVEDTYTMKRRSARAP